MSQGDESTKSAGAPSASPLSSASSPSSAPSSARENRLSSWKEIADYLDCDERTCLRWEKSHGLPIYRLEGSKKSRVFAYRDEIDRWQRDKSSLLNGKALAGGAGSAEAEAEAKATEATLHTRGGTPVRGSRAVGRVFGQKRGPRRAREGESPVRRRSIALWGASSIIVLAAAIMAALGLSVPREPVDFRIERNELVILNIRGQELWRYKAGDENLVPRDQYSVRFKTPEPALESGADLALLVFDDLDNDGKVEVLFSAHTLSGRGNGHVICFSHKGKEMWRFEMGRPLEFGTTLFSGDFVVRGFDSYDLNGDGNKEIVVLAHQLHRFPTRLAVLDKDGHLLGDYWNSGQLANLLFIDLDGDGRREILVGGTNNEYGQGVLIVFDAADVRGSSPQADERYRWKDMEFGSQLQYIRIPRPDAELAVEFFPIDAVSQLISLRDGRLAVWSGRSGLEYVFDSSLNIVEVRGSHAFQVLHENARQGGKISGAADAAYFEDLRRRVLYWDGSGWTHESALAIAKNRNRRK